MPALARGRALARTMVGVLVVLPALACDLDVADPSVIRDDALDNPVILPALLNGVRGSFTFATTGPVGGYGIYMAGAFLTDEGVHSGDEPILRRMSDGVMQDDWPEVEALWAEGSRARWTAENLVTRMDGVLGDTPPGSGAAAAARLTALVWAGLSNRVLGENFCEAVIDGGDVQPSRAFHERAEAQFTRAIELASAGGADEELRLLALAGRAQVRMHLGDWNGAVADAALVPTEFDFKSAQYYPSEREANGFRTASLPPYSMFTIWGTPFAEWGQRSGTSTGDARVRYTIPTSGGRPALGVDKRRPFVQQLKYSVSAAGISVAKGTEMRLIEAEAALVAHRWTDAVARVQEVRDYRNSPASGMKLPAAAAAGEEEAWTLLMRERGIELWLEGRRLGDLRRWAVLPGTVPFTVVREAVGDDPANDVRRNVLDVPGALCIPVGRREHLANAGD